MTTETRTRPDAQAGLWDETIEDSDLEELLEDHQEAKAAARRYPRLQKQVKQRLASLVPGRRYRIGQFVVIAKAISGGGFYVKTWESKSFKVKSHGG